MPEVDKELYYLEIDVFQNGSIFRHETLFFRHVSQALKVMDRFKDFYADPKFVVSTRLEKVETIYENANEYHGI